MFNANNTSDMKIKINYWCSSNVGFKGGVSTYREGQHQRRSHNLKISLHRHICVRLFAFTRYTECPGGNVPDFGRMFLKLKYTDITKNTCIRSWTVTEIMEKEKCDLLAVPRTVPGSRDVLPVHWRMSVVQSTAGWSVFTLWLHM